MRKKILGFGALILLSPLGIMLPLWGNSGDAWGEWSMEEIAQLSGRIPEGMKHWGSLWQAPIPDYSFFGWEKASLLHQSLATIVSALVGVSLLLGLGWGMGWLLSKKESR